MGKLILEKVKRDVETLEFECGVESINKYIKESYYPTIIQDAYTYKICYRGKSIGYIQFLFREVELDNFPDDISDKDSGIKVNKLTAVHIRFLAIDVKYQKRHLGTAVLQMAIKRIEDLSEDWPIRVITIDARSDLVQWYEREGFKKMPINTSGQDGITVAMYYGCLKNEVELQIYMEEMYEV